MSRRVRMVSVTVVDDATVQPWVKGLSVGQAEAAGRGAPRSASVMVMRYRAATMGGSIKRPLKG